MSNRHLSTTLYLIFSNTKDTLSSILAVLTNANMAIQSVERLVNKTLPGEHYHIAIDPASDTSILEKAVQEILASSDVTTCDVLNPIFELHLGGKIRVIPNLDNMSREDLAKVYTPGVAEVCKKIHEDPESAFRFTIRKNTVAIVTDGSAILGLGDLGPEAALPVMEGKAMLFKSFADVDAFPICLNTQDVDEIVSHVQAIAPTFGGINLEDIAAPRCFEIEKRLKETLDIPVFHDDQHGTAVVVMAALLNALKLTKKDPKDIKVVINGVGAAGTACMHLMRKLGVKDIIGCDSRGILFQGREGMNSAKIEFAELTNSDKQQGALSDAVVNADVFLGVSAPNVLTVEDLKRMKKDPIVFALANPTPEIMPEIANAHVAVMATGRSDYPNQINNLLAFPGIFRGALDCRASDITSDMLMVAAQAIADVIPDDELNAEYIIPSVFNEAVALRVADAVMRLMLAD